MNRRKRHLGIIGLLLFAFAVFGQEWPVPADQSALENPMEYTVDNVKQGKDLYLKNCKSCHGDPGKNNPLALVPLPVDVASEKMQANTDGELYYKITAGRGVMPPFAGTIPESERWNLVNFIRNFDPGREQVLIDAPPVKARLLASVNEDTRTVEILAESEGDGNVYNALSEVEVSVSSRKTFGNIEMGRTITNEIGRAEYLIPEDVIGDEEGYVSIVVSLGDGFEAEEVALEKAILGKPKIISELITGDVLWSTNENVSLWLVLSYLVAVLGSWFVIGYVIVQLVKIKRFGRST